MLCLFRAVFDLYWYCEGVLFLKEWVIRLCVYECVRLQEWEGFDMASCLKIAMPISLYLSLF